MRTIILFLLVISFEAHAQNKNFVIGAKGDTLNLIDSKGMKQGKWVIHVNPLRGEPGYEEEGMFKNDKKEGVWRKYTLIGDVIAIETYKWGNKDGLSQYFNGLGELQREERWKALNPDKLYDTVVIEEIDNPDHYKKVVVKNEGAGIRHGHWTYYDPVTGFITREEDYTLGVLEGGKKKDPVVAAEVSDEQKKTPKPKEVLDYEKKNAGKKKIRVRDGSTGL